MINTEDAIDSLPAKHDALGLEKVDKSLCNSSLVLSFHGNGGTVEQNHT